MKKQDRRKFIASAIAIGATTAASAFPINNREDKKQLAHHVFFWLKNSNSKEDREKLIEGLRTLKSVETVREIHIGVPADTEKRPVVDASYDVSELIFFDDLQGQSIYQNHPIHLKFVENYSHLWAKVIVYDMMEV